MSPFNVEKVGQQHLEKGYFQIGPIAPRQDTTLIADAVRTVVDNGFPAPDQMWQMLSRLENLLLGTSKNRRYSSGATKSPADDSASFPFRFIDVHAMAARDRCRGQFIEVTYYYYHNGSHRQL